MSQVNASPREIRVEMPATLENIDAADAQVCRLLADADAPIDRFAVRILLREALLNAVIHGNAEDRNRSVHVRAGLDEFGLTLTVRDEGPGFCWRDVEGNLDLATDSGRGIPLMRIYASKVTFNEAGNQVTLFRSYSQQAQSAAQGGAA